MATVDDKVVAMSFEHGRFESGVQKALTGLNLLRKALDMTGASRGLNDVNSAAQNVKLGHISQTLDDIRGKFSALSVTAITALATITTKAVHAGTALAKSLAITPIMGGFQEYELGLNSVQTILSNTASAGTTLKDVNATLAELNEYADQTIYNFGQMTKNIGTFTAAGVDLETATTSIKGISNLAAISGSSAEQAATAMYQLSQALSAGRVSLMDWNSVVNAGMGGTVFQRALTQTAVKMGTLDEAAVKLTGKMKNVSIEGQSFRNSLSAAPGEESWLTSEVLTQTLSQLSGDLTDAELAAEGYTKAQIKAIQTQAKMALDAATQVKTLSQLLSTTREAIGSGWAQTWQLIFGDFGEAKKLFTGLSTAIGGFVGRSAEARNAVLKDWKDLGGRTLLITGLKNAFNALKDILTPIKDAFRDIFPRKTGQDLFNLTKSFTEFTKRLKPSQETVENIRRTFRGLFALLDIGRAIVVGIFSAIGSMLGALGDGEGGLLSFTGGIGDFIVAIRDALVGGELISKFFDGLGRVLAIPVRLISSLAGAIGSLFSSETASGVSEFGSSLSPVERIISNLSEAWTSFVDSISGSESSFENLGEAIGEVFSSLGEALANGIGGINWDTLLAVINTGLFGGLVLLFKNFLGKNSIPGQIAGVFSSISGAMGGLEGAATALQQNIKAKTLKEIAIAIGILAAALFLLSTIEPKKLQNAMVAMTVAIGTLIGALALLNVAVVSPSVARLPAVAASLILLATAMLILSAAVKNLSSLDWEELAKGLTGVITLLGGVALVAGPLSKSSAGLIRAGVGITAIAIAMKILASAVKDFGALSWTELGKGLGAIAVSLVAIGGAAKLFPPNMVAIGAGLVIVAAALKMIVDVVAKFGAMSLETLGKGLGSIALALAAIGGAMHLMPKGMLLQAAALIAVGAALQLVAEAVGTMGGMSIEEIAKGLGTLAGSLVILAGGLMAMQGTIGGAIALGIAASGIALLAPAIKLLGGMSWGSIIKGLVTLGAALVVVAGAALLLQPAIPAMLGFGAALVLIGGGLALAGAGIALIGVGLSAIAIAGPAAVGILVNALTDLMEKLPIFVEDMVKALLSIVTGIADAAPEFVAAIVKILHQLSVAVVQAMPELVKAFGAIVQGLSLAIIQNAPALISAGIMLLKSLLIGIRNNIGDIVRIATEIITNFLRALGSELGDIVSAGLDLVVGLIRGITRGVSKIITAGADLILDFVTGLGKNAGKVVAAAATAVIKFVGSIGKNAQKVITAGAKAIIDFVTGLGKNASNIVAAGAKAMGKFIAGLDEAALEVGEAGIQAVIDLINGMADAIENEEYIQQLIEAAANLGRAVIKGLIKGLTDPLQLGKLWGAAKGLADGVLDRVGLGFLSKSPSKATEEIGKFVVQGLAIGIDKNTPEAIKSATAMSQGVVDSVEKIFAISSPSKVMTRLGQWVGTGFVKGLKDSVEQVNATFELLNKNLIGVIRTARESITEYQDKIKDLRKDSRDNVLDIAENQAKIKKLQKEGKADPAEINKLNAEIKKMEKENEKNTKAIATAQKAIETNQDLVDRARDAHKELTKGLTKEKTELRTLAKDFEKVTLALEDAKLELEDAVKLRDDAIKSFSEQYAETPEIDLEAKDPLGKYMDDIAKQASAVQTFSQTLDKLLALGLNERTYKKLLEEGTPNQKFADQLLAGGQTAVDKLNILDGILATTAETLGKNVGAELYQAGVDAAQGIVDGLEARLPQIVVRMNELGDTIVKAIKKKLKIKSPSEVFKEVGSFAIEGFARGLDASSKLAATAAENVGSAAVAAMKKTMSGLSTTLTSEINDQPTITPVLDLTKVRQEARSMADILNSVPITANASFRHAASISAERTVAEAAEPATPVIPAINFEQNNYSPEALSAIEIYRRTRNQLAQAQLAIA